MPFIAPPDYKPLFSSLTAKTPGAQEAPGTLKFGTNQYTVANLNDSATCPASTGSGRPVVVQNLSANQMQVFPEVGARIDNNVVNSAVTLSSGKALVLIDTGVGQWGMIRSV
jgi:hypothetical protein